MGDVFSAVGNRRLKMVEMEVYGTRTRALLDTGALRNIISGDLCRRLHLVPQQTTLRITVADGKAARVLGAVTASQLTLLRSLCRILISYWLEPRSSSL